MSESSEKDFFFEEQPPQNAVSWHQARQQLVDEIAQQRAAIYQTQADATQKKRDHLPSQFKISRQYKDDPERKKAELKEMREARKEFGRQSRDFAQRALSELDRDLFTKLGNGTLDAWGRQELDSPKYNRLRKGIWAAGGFYQSGGRLRTGWNKMWWFDVVVGNPDQGRARVTVSSLIDEALKGGELRVEDLLVRGQQTKWANRLKSEADKRGIMKTHGSYYRELSILKKGHKPLTKKKKS